MSIYGLQLPKQQQLQKVTGPIEKNKGFANIYRTPEGSQTNSFQWTSYQKPKPDLYSKITKGDGTLLTSQIPKTSLNFDVTLRNTKNPFFSEGVKQMQFNDQKFSQLVIESRFRDTEELKKNLSKESLSPKKNKEQFYDIKGNTFKNTLIPVETAVSAFKFKDQANRTSDYSSELYKIRQQILPKVQPKYKGYIRSGQILFNNINQINTRDEESPKLKVDGIRERYNTENKNVYPQETGEDYLQQQISNNQRVLQLSSAKKNNSPLKQSEEVRKTLDIAINNSPDFRQRKFNNYDNSHIHAPRSMGESVESLKLFSKRQSNQTSIDINKQEELQNPQNKSILNNLLPKNSVATRNLGKFTDLKSIENKAQFREVQSNLLKKWNHYDTNMNNIITFQKKIVNSKNYELDSRAYGIKDYGFQPLFETQLENKRKNEEQLLEQMNNNTSDEPAYKKKYTPITNFQKSVLDARITKLYGGKFSAYRPNLNYS